MKGERQPAAHFPRRGSMTRSSSHKLRFNLALGLLAVLAVSPNLVFVQAQADKGRAKTPASGAKATLAQAEKFIADAEKRLLDLSVKASRADWVNSNFITDDTQAIAAEARKEYTAAVTELAETARRFDGLNLPYDTALKLKLLKLALTLPAPNNPAERQELTRITVSMERDYGKGKYCPDGEGGKCLSLDDMEEIMATSRDPKELERVWVGWRTVAPSYRGR